jgi:hypothetical protein
LKPPDEALVLWCDEKSQCQALERTQPGLPLGIGHIRTKTHDYKRHGTITLFAALNYLEGKLILGGHPKAAIRGHFKTGHREGGKTTTVIAQPWSAEQG